MRATSRRNRLRARLLWVAAAAATNDKSADDKATTNSAKDSHGAPEARGGNRCAPCEPTKESGETTYDFCHAL